MFGATSEPATTAITTAEANRACVSLLRRASAGETAIVTSRHRPVAQIGPVRED